jgi:type II secretory ATPase GspE/PulE/Tfp pilus assembly ATPase PilB-like protein
MAFRATCPYCAANYPDVQDSHRGQKARCTRCNQWFRAVPPDPAVAAASERARLLRTRFVRVAAVILDPQVVASIPMAILERGDAVPIGRAGADLLVAMADPGDLDQVDVLRRHNAHVKPVLGLRYEIQAALKSLKEEAAQPAQPSSDPKLASLAGNKLAAEALDELEADYNPALADMAMPRPRTRPRGEGTLARAAVDRIFEAALAAEATEVRLLPQGDRAVVQARVENALQELPADASVPYADLVARLKDDAGCQAAGAGSEQSGSIPFSFGGRDFEFMARFLPGRAGELVQLRVIDAAAMRHRRNAERRQQIDEALAALATPDWPAADSGVDRKRAKNVLTQNMEQQLAGVRLTVAVLGEALDRGGVDVVLEPHQNQLRVLVRSGGADHFEPVMLIPTVGCTALVQRLHLFAALDLGQADKSQQGLFHLVRSGLSQEVRLMTVPTDLGLCIAMHLFRRAQ